MIFADRIVRNTKKEVDNMVNVLTWVFWLSFAVILLSIAFFAKRSRVGMRLHFILFIPYFSFVLNDADC